MSAPNDAANGPSSVGASNLGKRKKTKGKGSYLGTWLERAARHAQEEPEYDYAHQNPFIEPCRLNGFCPPEPVSLPTYPHFISSQYPGQYWPNDYRYIQSAHKNIQVQRPRVKRTQTNGVTNGFAYLQPKHVEESNDYASLPPIVTSVGDTASNSEANEKESGSARRLSDPGLLRLTAEQEGSGSEEGEDSLCDASNSKLLMCLVDQINSLKVANERLNKDLQETKAELQTVRQQTALWQRGSTSSLGPSNHNTLHNGWYTPGALTDVVREIREAARLREEALYAKVRSLVEERTLNQSAMSLDKSTDSRNYDDIKSELRAAESDKRRMRERLARLEDEIANLRNANGLLDHESEEGASRLRRELQDTRRELQDARRAKQQADEHTYRLERLITQLRSAKLNGAASPGPASLASGAEDQESPATAARVRRVSNNSNTSPHTIVFGPVTDL